MKKNLVLTGMMGVGKSTVGKKLARKLKLKFIDIDQLIEKREKKGIQEIFELKGEDYFRKIEKKVCIEQLSQSSSVIALGGGAFLNRSIRKEIKNTSVSFWLDLKLEILIKRLKKVKKRPLLSQDNIEQSVNRIYSQRKKFYNKSDFKIKCNTEDTVNLENKIIKLYESKCN